MCDHKSVPAPNGARFVLSEIGDILSPKSAPQTIIPAVTAGLIPKDAPIPINTIPNVLAVPQEVPTAIDMIEQRINPTGKNKAGVIHFNP